MDKPKWQRKDPRLEVELDHVKYKLWSDAPVKGPRKATRIAAFEQAVVRWIDETYNPDTYVPTDGDWSEETL